MKNKIIKILIFCDMIFLRLGFPIIPLLIVGAFINVSEQKELYKNNWSKYRKFEAEYSEQFPTVCVTATGELYHSCYHYNNRNYEMSLYDVIGRKSCSVCNPPLIEDYEVHSISKPPKTESLSGWFYLGILVYLINSISIVMNEIIENKEEKKAKG